MRRIAISDFHFGSPGALGSLPFVLERLEPELEWADEVVIVGDLFTLMFADWKTSIEAAQPFLNLVAKNVDSVVFVPGNHDHHFTIWAADRMRREQALGYGLSDPRRCEQAEQLLEELMPTVKVRAAYPFVELDGVSYIHGHHVEAMVCETGIAAIDYLLWYFRARWPRKLKGYEYESLLAPFYEIAYMTQQNSPGSVLDKQRKELLEWSRAGITASGSQRQMRLALLGRMLSDKLDLPWYPKPLRARIELMALICRDFAVPSGPVVYGHTHVPHEALTAKRDGGYKFWNSGSWHVGKRHSENKMGRHLSLPGTLLRIEDGKIEMRELLADMTSEDLQLALVADH